MRGMLAADLHQAVHHAAEQLEGVVRQAIGEVTQPAMADHRPPAEPGLTNEAKAGVRVLEALGRTVSPSAAVEQEPAAPKYMKPDQFAAYKRVSRSTVYRWLKLGMPAQKLGPKLVRIKVENAEAWFDNGGPKKAIKRSATISSRTRGKG